VLKKKKKRSGKYTKMVSDKAEPQ